LLPDFLVQSYLRLKNHRQLVLLALFFSACLLAIITTCYHEMWRDESQAFLLVRDSKNLQELWHYVRYEGHPFLWHFILFLSHQVSDSIYTIQVVHVIIGLAVVALIIFYAPFSVFEKCLLSFSYFFSFEYLVISRNYAIGIFFLLLAICVFSKSKSRYNLLYVALCLGLAANSNIYALIISCCLFASFVLTKLLSNRPVFIRSRTFYFAALTFLCFLVLALWQLLPPADRTPKLEVAYNFSPARMVKIWREISEVLFYFPNLLKHEKYWGFSIFGGKFFSSGILNNVLLAVPQLLTAILLALFFAKVRKSTVVVVFFAASSAGLLLFMYFIFDRGLLRHTGAFFILLIAALWLYKATAATPFRSSRRFDRLFTVMLLIQFAGSIVVHVYEIKYPFSGAKDAARFLTRSHRNNDKIILHPDFEGMSVLHYGKINQVYYPTIDGRGSFIKFSTARKPRSYWDIFKIAQRDDIETMVFNNRKNDSIINAIGYQLIYNPKTTSAVHDEDFWIYGKKSSK
jgi:hypothetical protein